MIIYNHNKGRLGNSLFRLFANIVFSSCYKIKPRICNYVNNSTYIIDDNFFITWMKKISNNLDLDSFNFNNSFLFNGYYQHDAIYMKYKNEIIDFIKNNPDLIIKTDRNESYKIINFIDYSINKKYKIVVHLRLEDFIDISFVIDPISIKNMIEQLIIEYPDEQICFVLNKPKTDLEIKYINFFKNNFSNILFESNDVLTDFTIMRNSEVLVCSCSTLSWAAVILSNSINCVYMPDYKNLNGPHQTFKYPIKNTKLYAIKTCSANELAELLN